MPGWRAVEHFSSVLVHEGTLAALEGHKDHLVHSVGISVLGVKPGRSLGYQINLQDGGLVQ